MKRVREMDLGELAAFVQSHLRQKGIDVVLTGGAAVSVHSTNRYVSKDIDLVNTGLPNWRVLDRGMAEIGFKYHGRHFKHAETEILVEFSSSPLTVGEEAVKEVEEKEVSSGLLKLISATDCVKDRLLSFFHWGDLQALDQAVLVAQTTKVDLKELQRWARVEGELSELLAIMPKLARRKAGARSHRKRSGTRAKMRSVSRRKKRSKKGKKK